MSKLTLTSIKKELDDLKEVVTDFIKAVKPDFIVKDEPHIDLSQITEIGSEVKIDLGTLRLVETNYNGQKLKCWQFKNVFKAGDLGLGLPNNSNVDGYPSAKTIHIFLEDLFNKLPNWLKEQIVEIDVPCFIPSANAIKDIKSKLFLLSATEMCQNRYYLAKEGTPLAYYIKNVPSFDNWHWLRTPDITSKTCWGDCNDYGDVYGNDADYSDGVAPVFCTR